MLANLLLPNADLRLDSVATSEQGVTATVASTGTEAECPDCHHTAQRIHSHYTRTLADLPVSGQRVHVRLRVRRFLCNNLTCPRKTFTERLPDFAPQSARRTKRLASIQTAVGLALGGEAGARLVQQLAIPTSPDTLLRLMRRQPATEGATPRVLGVDDWAWKKGRSYGTILIDLERQCAVDVLPDRTAETLATWLKQHPGVEIISRDRGGAYAEGASQGAPNARQVADRWHLLVNLRETVQRLLDRHHTCLPALHLAPAQPGPSVTLPSAPEPETQLTQQALGEPPPLPKAERLRLERRTRRLDRFTKVVTLHRRGVSIRALSQQLGVDRHTIRRYIAADAFPEIAKRRPRPSVLDPWKPYLRQRWDEGCHNGSRLWREIQAQGYQGSRSLLSAWIADLRKTAMRTAEPASSGDATGPTATASSVRPERQLSAQQAAWLVVKQPAALTTEEQAALTKMRQAHADIEQTYTLAQTFGQLVRERKHLELDQWIASAQATGIRELKSFAAGLLRDKTAVSAALSLPWSNGQVEGHVHRLKLLKRQMYGRASFDLLRRRVLQHTG
jgi:transposase